MMLMGLMDVELANWSIRLAESKIMLIIKPVTPFSKPVMCVDLTTSKQTESLWARPGQEFPQSHSRRQRRKFGLWIAELAAAVLFKCLL